MGNDAFLTQHTGVYWGTMGNDAMIILLSRLSTHFSIIINYLEYYLFLLSLHFIMSNHFDDSNSDDDYRFPLFDETTDVKSNTGKWIIQTKNMIKKCFRYEGIFSYG